MKDLDKAANYKPIKQNKKSCNGCVFFGTVCALDLKENQSLHMDLMERDDDCEGGLSFIYKPIDYVESEYLKRSDVVEAIEGKIGYFESVFGEAKTLSDLYGQGYSGAAITILTELLTKFKGDERK